MLIAQIVRLTLHIESDGTTTGTSIGCDFKYGKSRETDIIGYSIVEDDDITDESMTIYDYLRSIKKIK